ncbi:hypothetical protein [Dialister hominis]|jgi:hypothetical protein|uniref:hypothetical protein n=1 Tax=Dialister hominis TaxID=2582419 RepID=UPI003AB7F9A7
MFLFERFTLLNLFFYFFFDVSSKKSFVRLLKWTGFVIVKIILIVEGRVGVWDAGRHPIDVSAGME